MLLQQWDLPGRGRAPNSIPSVLHYTTLLLVYGVCRYNDMVFAQAVEGSGNRVLLMVIVTDGMEGMGRG